MSKILIALFLGLVQGLTEFLPVSSSGHLVILQGFCGKEWTGNVLFDISVHLGTTIAVIVYFSRELLGLIKGVMPRSWDRQKANTVFGLILTTAVTGIIGLVFKGRFEAMFSMPALVAVSLMITGLLDFTTELRYRQTGISGHVRVLDAIVIGVFQGIAIIPGISRSGSTIFAGVILGMDALWATQYSFLASIPAILGAALLEYTDMSQVFSLADLAGMLSSFIVGLISLRILVWTLKKHRYFIFAVYCWLVGAAYLVSGVL